MKKFDIVLNGAAFFVLFGLSFILGIMGKPTEMGLSIISAAIGLSFLNIDKIKKFKGAGFEAEMQEKIEAIIEKETEPPQLEEVTAFKVKAIATDENAKKVINSLSNPKFTWRYVGGLVKESGLKKSQVLQTLNWLIDNDLGKVTEGEHGRLWALSAKGRGVFKNSTI